MELLQTIRLPDKACAVVVLPGLGANQRMWAPLFAELEAQMPGWGIYLGKGVSVRATDKSSGLLPEVARWIALELEEAEIEQLVLIGHSLGAFLAIEVALSTSAKVERIVLPNGGLADVAELLDKPIRMALTNPALAVSVAALFVNSLAPIPLALKRKLANSDWASTKLFRAGFGDRIVRNRKLRELLIVNPARPEAAKGLWLNRHHWVRFTVTAGQIAQEITILSGQLDPYAGPASSARMSRFLQNAANITLSGSGHCIPLDSPGLLASIASGSKKPTIRPNEGESS